MDLIKRSPEPIINSWTMKYVMARLPNWASKLMFDTITNQCSMVVSNGFIKLLKSYMKNGIWNWTDIRHGFLLRGRGKGG